MTNAELACDAAAVRTRPVQRRVGSRHAANAVAVAVGRARDIRHAGLAQGRGRTTAMLKAEARALGVPPIDRALAQEHGEGVDGGAADEAVRERRAAGAGLGRTDAMATQTGRTFEGRPAQGTHRALATRDLAALDWRRRRGRPHPIAAVVLSLDGGRAAPRGVRVDGQRTADQCRRELACALTREARGGTRLLAARGAAGVGHVMERVAEGRSAGIRRLTRLRVDCGNLRFGSRGSGSNGGERSRGRRGRRERRGRWRGRWSGSGGFRGGPCLFATADHGPAGGEGNEREARRRRFHCDNLGLEPRAPQDAHGPARLRSGADGHDPSTQRLPGREAEGAVRLIVTRLGSRTQSCLGRRAWRRTRQRRRL